MSLAIAVATPAFADSYLAYTQGGIASNSDIYVWGSNCGAGGCDLQGINTCDTPEGGTSLRFREPVWGGFGFFHLAPDTLRDLSAFQTGEVRFFLKTPLNAATIPERADVSATIKCNPGTGSADQIIDLDSDTNPDPLTTYGWDPNSDDWQEISIPMCDFFGGTCDATTTQCLQNVESPLVINLRVPPADGVENVAVWVDYVRWVTPNEHAGASSVTTNGRQLVVNGKPFSVNGIAYQPLSVGENWQSAWTDRSDRYEVDFPKMAAAGANTVRLYAPILTSNMLDKAWDAGLFVIPTFGVDDFQLSCDQGKLHMKDRFVEMVQEWGDHPAILFWLVGNEVKSYLSNSDLNTDFFPQLEVLARDGGATQPVGTAMADLDDICVSGISDDLALQNVDLWGTQLYRGCDFGVGAFNAFAQYEAKTDCDRPLVVTEFGVDSWKSNSTCSGGPPTSCFVNSDCPQGTCSSDSAPCNIDTDCLGAQTCIGGQFCDGAGTEDAAMQDSCMGTLLSDADAGLAIKTGGVSSGQVIFEWLDEWWKAACLPTGGWEFHDTCANTRNNNYTMDPAVNEEFFGLVANESFCSTTTTLACVSDDDCPGAETCSTISNPDARVNKTVLTNSVGNSWLGPVCNMVVDAFNPATGETTVSFNPAAGNAVDHNLHYGPLSAVSTYGYSGSETGLGSTGSGSAVTLPAGSLFWVVAAENGVSKEGCYGTDSVGVERPCVSGNCDIDQISGWNCLCSSP